MFDIKSFGLVQDRMESMHTRSASNGEKLPIGGCTPGDANNHYKIKSPLWTYQSPSCWGKTG